MTTASGRVAASSAPNNAALRGNTLRMGGIQRGHDGLFDFGTGEAVAGVAERVEGRGVGR